MTDISPQIDWLARLVAHDTTSSKSNLCLVEDVEAYLHGLGVTTKRVANEDGSKTNLYAVVGPAVEGGVVLSGHTDVVPVAGQDWLTDPFVLTEKDGRLYGRGTCDMKAFSAIGLSLVPEMLAANLTHPLIFALSYDEEVGCLGAPDMIDEIAREVPAPSAVIVGEPTMMKVIDGHKGISSFRTQVTGYTTHSSQANRGVSAVMMAARIISFIEGLSRELEENAPPASTFDPPHTTMTVNVVQGGTQLNIMAGACSFDWDMRSVPGDDVGEVFGRVQSFMTQVETEMRAKHESCAITTDWMTRAPHLAPKPGNRAVELAQALTGQNHTEVVSYATEGGQFQEANFHTVICGPGSIDQAHQPNEFISLAQVEAGTAFMRRLIARLRG
ncbi:acetylornithine deacetylase [Parvularcula sp. IMCC14364]|uniref:acetylornithine deacetylase n=1 Tax=Parvularcula sp. IMCC14364 TaxID=3067902 RepID=UPI0027427895|nr:acetylornithine deacetylase [Parvularcula sp. IMCC14364]